MKQIITFLGIFLFSFFKMNAQETSSVEQKIESIFAPLSELMNTIVFYSVKVGSVKLPFIIIAIVIAAIFFTIFLNFANVRLMPVALKILKGEAEAKDQIDEPEETGQVTPFQALATALSASVGIGNIGGVAIAIALGGAGATFWMIIAGLLAMSVKMIEATLGVKYREVGEDGQVYGGPMYYLKNGLAEMKLPKLGKVLAYAYALFLVFGSFGASMFQSNQAVVQAQKLMGLESPLGLAVALLALVGFVIVGGVKRIGKVAEKIVPMMGILYVGSALIILGLNYELIPSTISLMLSEAFNVNSFAGGVIGVLIVGFQRAFFSNEAGLGTSSIAHAAVKTRYAASEGIVGAIEPFVDTVIVCTMTAMVIVLMNLKLNLFDYGSVTDSAVIHNQTGESVGGVELTSVSYTHLTLPTIA